MHNYKCPCCGATNYTPTTDGGVVCNYCNTTFSINDKNSSTTTPHNHAPSNNKNDNPLKINVALFVILFVTIPPAAIAYLIIKVLSHHNGNNNNNNNN